MSEEWARSLVLMLLLVFVFGVGKAQKNEPRTVTVDYTSIHAFYVAGGQFYNNTLLFSPGFGAKASLGKKVHDDIDVGIGSGFIALNKERFFPAFAEIVSYKNNKSNVPYLKFQVGYGFAQYSDNSLYEDYRLDGGICFNATLGRRIRVSDGFLVLFDFSYGHQTATLSYTALGEKPYKDKLDYEMFMLSLGIVIE